MSVPEQVESHSAKKNKLLDLWNSMGGGVAAVAILISASAVFSSLASMFDIPLSQWFFIWTENYRKLMFPIIDGTIGQVLKIFGIQIIEPAKNLLIIFSMFGTSLVRTFYIVENAIKFREALVFFIFWPFIIIMMFIARELEKQVRDFEETKGTDNYFSKYSVDLDTVSAILKNFKTQLLFVFLVVVIAISLNAAGVLN